MLKIGDWVNYRTRDGDKLLSYIVELEEDGDAYIYTTKVISGDKCYLHQSIYAPITKLKKAPQIPLDETQIENLIDVSLISGDKKWFSNLVEVKKAIFDS